MKKKTKNKKIHINSKKYINISLRLSRNIGAELEVYNSECALLFFKRHLRAVLATELDVGNTLRRFEFGE